MTPVHGSWSCTEWTSTWRRWRRPKTTTSTLWRKFWCTCCSCKTKTNINTGDFNDCVTMRPAWMDRRGARSVRQMFVAFEVSKKKIGLIGHDSSVPRKEDGAVEFKFQNSRLLSIGQFEHGWISCKKEEDVKRDFSIVWIHSMLIPFYTLEQFKATREENTSILHCMTTCCCWTISPSTIYHFGSSHDLHSSIPSGMIPSGKEVKKGRHAVFFTAGNPMFISNYREQDYDMTKSRIAVHKHDWKVHQNTMYWCNLRVAQSKGLHFSQTRSTADHPLQHSTGNMYRESDNRKDRRRIVQHHVSISRCTAKGCTEAELELWTPGHYKLRSEKVFRSFWQARWNVQRNLSRWNRRQNPRITELSCPRTRSHSQTGSPETDAPVRESPEQRSTTRRPTTEERVQSVQREVEGYELQQRKHGVLRDLRDHSKHTLPQLYVILTERYCILHRRNMLATLRQKFEHSTVTATMFCLSQLRH